MGSALSWLASVFLLLIHVGYSVVNAARSLREGLCARDPRPLTAKRKQVPSHLAVLFASYDHDALDRFEGEMLDNIERVVAWCQVAGVKRLTVYDRRGVLARSSFALRERLQPDRIEDDVSASDSDIDYPLTPPLSDAGSRPLSPQRETPPKLHVISMSLPKADDASQTPKKRHSLARRHPHSHHKSSGTEDEPFYLHVISHDSGKAAIANTATGLLRQALADALPTADTYTVKEKELNAVLEGKYGFTSPELMIIHNILPQRRCKDVLELHGFPPWQVRLTEFHHTQYSMSFWRLLWRPVYIALSEVALRRALDEFASAEMRLGK